MIAPRLIVVRRDDNLIARLEIFRVIGPVLYASIAFRVARRWDAPFPKQTGLGLALDDEAKGAIAQSLGKLWQAVRDTGNVSHTARAADPFSRPIRIRPAQKKLLFVLTVFENIRAIRIPKLGALDLVDDGALRIVIIETPDNDSFGSLCGFRFNPLRHRRRGSPGQPLDGFHKAAAVEMFDKRDDVAADLASPAIPNLLFKVD
jgi:hypothetical protein